MTQVLDLLQLLGLAGNEAKAYTALLVCQPATAYEIAKQAGLPTSKIYETVSRLERRAMVQRTSSATDNTSTYIALSPGDFVKRIRQQTNAMTSELEPLLDALQNDQQAQLILPLSGDDIIRMAREAIDDAQHSVVVSLWPEELGRLESNLHNKASAGIKTAIVHFGKPTISIGATYHHPVERTIYEEKGGRGLTLVVDSELVVIGHFFPDHSEGAWSRHPAFVTVAEDYVKHDVYITKVTRFLASEMKQRFGEDYARLRNIFDADA